jgi:hypothetical protein
MRSVNPDLHKSGTQHMHLCEEFQKHAEDCRRTAKTIKDPALKATWSAMAERWARAAQIYSHDEQQVETMRRARLSRLARRSNVHLTNDAVA